MAITGDGKSLDTAYVVHDYWELKAVCGYSETYKGNTNYVKYVKLANDIDCNSSAYSIDFEWEGIDLGGGSSDGTCVDLNLNNKSIKNVMIANGSWLFKGQRYDSKYSKIHDGKILNIFCNFSKSIIDTGVSSGGCVTCEINNVSISVNGTSLTDYAFNRCNFDCSSLYFKSFTINNVIVFNFSGDCSHKNSDFYFDIKNKGTYGKIFYNQQSKSTADIDNCRISGDLGTVNLDPFFKSLGNCVVDTIFTCKGSSTSYHAMFSNCTGIYNGDKVEANSYVNLGSMKKVTSEEIKNADLLSGKGFVVTDIRPATSTT